MKNPFVKFWRSLWKDPKTSVETAGLLALFVPSVVDPLIYTINVLKDKTLTKENKDTMLRQNWTHHLFNLALETSVLLIAKPVIGAVLRHRKFKFNKDQIDFRKMIGGFLALMLAKSFIRPFVMLKFAEHDKAQKAQLETQQPEVGDSLNTEVMSKPLLPSNRLDLGRTLVKKQPAESVATPVYMSPASSYLSSGYQQQQDYLNSYLNAYSGVSRPISMSVLPVSATSFKTP